MPSARLPVARRPRGQAREGPVHPTARRVAVTALLAVEEGERSNVVLPRLLGAAGLGERDRAFATELTYGALRMMRACDWLVGRFAQGPLEPEVRAVLRTGAYQLAFMRVPAYAAVAATVDECPPRARSLVNAVMRRMAELVGQGPVPWPSPGVRMSYPDWVMQRLAADLGPRDAAGALAKMNEAPTVSVREDGYTQDPASQAVAEHVVGLLGGAGGRALDLCAAPGGKATLVAHHASGVVAADVARSRSEVVAGNAQRLGLGNLAVVTADGRHPPFRDRAFDAVLVDAPCTGLGVLRRRPDARWRVQPGDVGRLAGLQRELLSAAAPLVAPGGVLVYSVCTLTREETADVGEWLVSDLLPGWQVEAPVGPPWEPLGSGARLLPQRAGTDGMYLLALRRPA